MKKFLLLFALISLIACTNENGNNINTDVPAVDSQTVVATDTLQAPREEPYQVSLSGDVATYRGEWFSISYPEEFEASPVAPVNNIDDYFYVETDEAFFLSPDSAVEFYIFSPQWGGMPYHYVNPQKNESMLESRLDTIEVGDGLSNLFVTYLTVGDNDGKYQRSIYIEEGESTTKVFGIKYRNAEVLDFYRDTYRSFKKSLEQYAD